MEIRQPLSKLKAYTSRKCKTTVKVQAVATMELCFIDVSVGWPGAMHDSRIFRNSALSAALRRNLENTPYTIWLPILHIALESESLSTSGTMGN